MVLKSMSVNKIQVFISFFVFLLSGITIFNPLLRSENFGLSCLTSIITAVMIFEIYMVLFSKIKKKGSRHRHSFFAIVSCLFAIFSCIIYLTEIIKDIAHISGKNVSLFYYSLLALAILAVSYCLCYNTEKGIFRFSILAFSSFIVFIIVLCLSFLTTKRLFWQNSFSDNLSSIFCGVLAGIFFSVDIPLYLGVFSKILSANSISKALRPSFWFAVLYYSAISILPFMIFGKSLVNSIPDPIFSATKLFPQVDMTEIGAVIKITGFMIKSSVYIYFCTDALMNTAISKRLSHTHIILILYSSIPIIFLTVSFFDKTLEYGAFQYLIYANASGLGIFSALSCIFTNKQ